MIAQNSEVYNPPTYLFSLYTYMEKDLCRGLYTSLFCAIIPALFPYFLPFWYPYILLHFQMFFITCSTILSMISGTSASYRAHALRAVLVRLSYKDFFDLVHKSYFIETYLADSSDRDHSESPVRSTVEVTDVRANRPPLSARTTSPKEPTIAVQLSLA